MITQQAAELEALAGEVTVLRLSQQHSQSLASRSKIITGVLLRAKTATATARILREQLGEASTAAPLVGKALSSLSEWRSALEADLGGALAGDLFASFQDAIEQAIRDVERSVTVMWQRYAALALPDTSDEVLDALANDPRARTTVLRIRHLTETARRLRDRPVPTVDELADFDRATSELQQAWSTLDVEDLSEEVVTFLRMANSDRGAPIEGLTRSVVAWLAERGASAYYVIRPAER